MSSIRTKVDRQALIKRLNDTLKNNEKVVAENKKRRAGAAKFQIDFANKVLKSLKQKDIAEISFKKSTYYSNASLVITFDKDAVFTGYELPEELTEQSCLGEYETREILQALKVLELSTENEISMAALKDVVRYL